MRLLASGIDTLNLSVRGAVQESVWDLLAEVQKRARVSEDDEMVSFPITEEAFECRPYGWRGYTYWLSSHDFELMVGRSTKFPAVLVQLHAAFLHSMGIDASLDQVERLLRLDVLAGPFKEAVSRIDLHADVQDWKLQTADLDRFVGYGRHRRAFEENRQVFQSGTKLSGFMFGKDALVARIYDKTARIRKQGISWLPDLWGEEYDPNSKVWRVSSTDGERKTYYGKTQAEVRKKSATPWRSATRACSSLVARQLLSAGWPAGWSPCGAERRCVLSP
jgi:hypothetical protein